MTRPSASHPAGAPFSVCRIRGAALSCVGCCLYAFAGKEATLAAIRRNTAAFAQLVPGDEAALLRFRDREAPAAARKNGVDYKDLNPTVGVGVAATGGKP